MLVAGIMGIALALSVSPATAADRGGGGSDYLLVSPTLNIDDVILNENDAGTQTFTFTISLSKPALVEVCVDVYTQDGSAKDDNPNTEDEDYVAASATVCIPAGQTSATFDVLVNGDAEVEFDEVFFVKLANVTGTGATIGDGTGNGLILNDDVVTPTLLQTFDAATAEEGITLRWQFANAAEVAASWLDRAVGGSDSWSRVDASIGTEDGMLVLTDRSVESEGTYQYRLTAQMKNGQTMHFGPITAKAGVLVKEFALARVSPTPTRGPAMIEYAVPRAAHVKLSILDVQGRVADVLVDGVVSTGRHTATWNAGSTRAGVYFVSMEAAGKRYVKRVIVTE